MDKIENFNVQLPADYDGKDINIVLREGDAPQPVNLTKTSRTGTIFAVTAFVAFYYKTKLDPSSVEAIQALGGDVRKYEGPLVTFKRNFNPDKRELYIKFNQQPTVPNEGYVITGELKVNGDLDKWGLNSGKNYAPADAINHVRRMAHTFPSPEAAASMITLLRNLDVAFDTARTKQDDGRGNKQDSIKEEIRFRSQQIPDDMKILLPLYHATAAVNLNLQIELSRMPNNDVGISFWCLELETYIREKGESIMQDELQKLAGHFCIIEEI